MQTNLRSAVFLTAAAALAGCSSTNNFVGADGGVDADTVSDGATDACDESGEVALATGQFQPGFLAVGSGTVYWSANGAIMSRPTSACSATAPSTFATWSAQAIRADATNVYFSSGALVMQCPASNCSNPITLSMGASVAQAALAVDATNVYWGSTTYNGGSNNVSVISKCAIGGCNQAPTAVVSFTNTFGVTCVAVDGTNVYWGMANGDVMSCPVGGCATPSIVASGQSPSAIAADGKNIYWVSSAANPGSIMKCPVSGCAGNPTVLGTGGRVFNGLATDGLNVYWLDAPNLMKCSVGGCGGNPTVLASGQDNPLGPALDDKSVYWTTLEVDAGMAGNVMKLTPK